ncbi:hypothetical protein CVT24_000268 [Panaeolus cyanescens]|uniref:Uncharacterized protein n=1 Tax=Panaeolus cyanescens TaxID=181874 RepID=A0A409YD80_9AGAR|nr:hypothetical protein CVT24_000268 [Panaeolus cyanescens]
MPAITFDAPFFTADLLFDHESPAEPHHVKMFVEEADTESDSDNEIKMYHCACGSQHPMNQNCAMAPSQTEGDAACDQIVPSSVHEEDFNDNSMEVEPPAAEQTSSSANDRLVSRRTVTKHAKAKQIQKWEKNISKAKEAQKVSKKRKVFLNLNGTGKDLNIRLTGDKGIQFYISI